MVSRPTELPRRSLAKRCRSLSTHTASISQTIQSFPFLNEQTIKRVREALLLDEDTLRNYMRLYEA